jgi:phenylpropionate dioxygenase-like ring-hydroxylating dioxygenase large terminal subunit
MEISLKRPTSSRFSEQEWLSLAKQWYPVARADASLEKPTQVILLDLQLAIFRLADGIHICRDICPHRGLLLSTGRVEVDELVCAYHGLRFSGDGQCRGAPGKTGLKTVECLKILILPVVSRYELIWTCLMPGADVIIPKMLVCTDLS